MNNADRIFEALEGAMTYAEIRKELGITKDQVRNGVKELQKRGVVFLTGNTSNRRIMKLPDAIKDIRQTVYSLERQIQKINEKL